MYWPVPKTFKLALALLPAALFFGACRPAERSAGDGGLDGGVSVSGAFALYPLAVQWSNDFSEKHPAVRMDVSAGGAGKGMTDVLNGMVDFAMLSRELHEEELQKGAEAFAVGTDAVIPVFSSSNPLRREIMAHGISREDARKIWVTGEYTRWGQLLGTDDDNPIRVYTRSDACGAAQTFASWFGASQEDLTGTAVYGDPGISKAVSGDVFSIGFNNMAYAYDARTLLPADGLLPLPIDADGDGEVSGDESFYATRGELAAAIEDGRLSAPPARHLYLVGKGVPTDSTAAAFLRYVVTEGQRFNAENGFVRISRQTSRSIRHRLSHAVREGHSRKDNTSKVLLVISGCLLVFLLSALLQWIVPSRTARRVFRQRFSDVALFLLTISSLLLLAAMLAGLFVRSAPIFETNSLHELLTGSEWKPSQGKFGFQPFILGTIAVTALSICISLPLSLLTAVYLTEYAPKMLRNMVNPALDILAALPSVIYGVWGILMLIPLLGYSLLTASLVLSVMVLPIQINLFTEIFSGVPRELRESSMALGATRWQTTRRVVLRKSVSGIFAAVVLAVSKCIGETIAVMMVCGCLPRRPGTLLEPFYTLPALIGNNYGEMASVPLYESAIMFAALLLLLFVLVFNIISRVILYRIEKQS